MAKRKVKVSARTWAIRGAIAIVMGLGLGFATGAVAVRVLQPPGISASDSIANEGVRRTKRAASAAVLPADDAAAPDSASRDTRPVTGTIVPKLIGLEEGDARSAIVQAGFTIGTVMFKSSGESPGTVLSSYPVPGEIVQLPATISLILSDGHRPKDTVPTSPDFNSASSNAPVQ